MVFQGQDAWRRHPFFQGLWKSPFPGIQKAAAIYAVYMSLEYAYKVCMSKNFMLRGVMLLFVHCLTALFWFALSV